MLKTKNEFLDHFARLGVFSKVQALMDDGSESECSVIKSPTDLEFASSAQATPTSPTATEDASSTAGKYTIHTATQFKPKTKCDKQKVIMNNCCLKFQVTNKQMMQKKSFKAKHINGMNGAYAVVVIVYMFGPIRLLSNCQMDQMAGFAL